MKRARIKKADPAAEAAGVTASERKVLESERRHLQKVRGKIAKDFDKEHDRLAKAVVAAQRTLSKFDKRRKATEPQELARVDRRLAIIAGRLGF
jgi:signal transduction protein with GAF and PtsI domain